MTPHASTVDGYTPGGVAKSQAHDWSRVSTGPEGISPRPNSKWITDSYGRVCLMRGANVSGGNKIPSNHFAESFPHKHQTVTFVGRPFPLEEAPQHFARLRRWGLTFIRFNITWEAIEHEGPGKYDTAYLNYVRSLLSLLPHFGLVAFVSLHQDVWSRYSGGSGAPAWTLETVGFDLNAIGGECGAAYLGGVQGTGVEGVLKFPSSTWFAGYQKLTASTMAYAIHITVLLFLLTYFIALSTLFWAGRTYAPKLRVPTPSGQEVNIQDFLQDCFLDAFAELVQAVGDLESVVGFEMMNEPHRGYISTPSLHEFDYTTDLHFHDTPNALQSFALGAGYAVHVPHYGMFLPRALYWGHQGARENYTLQIGNIVRAAYDSLNSARPVIIGECGIPMDMNEGEAFKSGDFEWHTRMMDSMMTALERNLVGFTLWNYNPDNDDVHGDFWNGENFSWFSRCRADSSLPSDVSSPLLDQSSHTLDTGARLLPVIVRPYPAKVAGTPLSFSYEPRTGAFKFVYDTSTNKDLVRSKESEIFLPASLAQPRKLLVSAPNMEWTYDAARQTLFVVHKDAGVHTLEVAFDPPLENQFVTKGVGFPSTGWIFALLVLILGWLGA
ncbi:hypothetical protein FRC06_002983, partial [Ceratobasidium sp. 370]